MTNWHKGLSVFGISALAAIITACGPSSTERTGMEAALGTDSIKMDSASAAKITLGNEVLTFEYLMSCSAGTIVTMAVFAEEQRDDMNYQDVTTLNVKAATDDGQDKGLIDVKYGDHFYIYEGEVDRLDKSVTWSGTFKKYAKDAPSKQIGEVEGNGGISC